MLSFECCFGPYPHAQNDYVLDIQLDVETTGGPMRDARGTLCTILTLFIVSRLSASSLCALPRL